METTELKDGEVLRVRAVKAGIENGRNAYDMEGTIDKTLPFEDRFRLMQGLLYQACIIISQSIAQEMKNGKTEEMEKFVPVGKQEIRKQMNSLIDMAFSM